MRFITVPKMKIEMIPVEKLEIDRLNVRFDEEFGDEMDIMLEKNIDKVGELKPLIVRPHGGKYGIVAGRRTFLAVKDKVDAVPCIIKELTDREAIEVSLSDNIFIKHLNPLRRARAFKKLVDMNPKGMVDVARKIGTPKSTMSEWLSILKLSDGMQRALLDGIVPYRDALQIARKKFTVDEQERLAKIVREQGNSRFKAELKKMMGEKETRGAPVGLFVVRLVLPKDTRSKIEKLAADANMKLADYCENVIIKHVKGG